MYKHNSTLTTRRRNYWRTDIEVGGRITGHLISTPAGFMLHSQHPGLRWFRRRYWRTPQHLTDAVRGIR